MKTDAAQLGGYTWRAAASSRAHSLSKQKPPRPGWHLSAADCDSLRSLHKFGLTKTLRCACVFGASLIELLLLLAPTLHQAKRPPCLGWPLSAADCDSLRSLHKFGLTKNAALRLCFWSLTYRTAASLRAHSPPSKKTAQRRSFCLVESGGLEPSTFRV